MQSRFISFEGGEGVGKTTLIGLLGQNLKKIGVEHIVTREPGGTPSAEAMRQVFVNHPTTDRLTPMAEFLLASAARSQHVTQKIKKSLDKNEWVLTDRFFDSSLVYQGILGGVDLKFIQEVNEKVCQGLQPDLTILIDLDPKTALDRVQKRNTHQITASHYDHEDHAAFKKIADGFRQIAILFPQRFFTVNGAKNSVDIVSEILAELYLRGFL